MSRIRRTLPSGITLAMSRIRVVSLWLVFVVLALLPASGISQSSLLEALANRGHPTAQFTVGKMYAQGKDVPRDFVRAHKWFSLAAAQGNREAARARDQLVNYMTPAQIAEAERLARTWKAGAVGETAQASKVLKPSKKLVADIQRRLTDLGYKPGPVDGLMGAKTRTTIRVFQTKARLPVDGKATLALRNQLAATEKKRKQTTTLEMARSARWTTPKRASIRLPTELKSAPNMSARSLRELSTGTPLLVVGKKGPWYEVEVESPGPRGEGWVKLTSVRFLPKTYGETTVSALSSAQTEAEPKESTNAVEALLAGFARGVTGLVGAGRTQSATTRTETSTIGIRGLTSGDLMAAQPNPRELQKLNRFVATDAEAMRFASEPKLVQVSVQYLPEPERVRPVTAGRQEEDR